MTNGPNLAQVVSPFSWTVTIDGELESKFAMYCQDINELRRAFGSKSDFRVINPSMIEIRHPLNPERVFTARS